ncbi:MAG TPA: TRAP transporter small permease subunit, partial [Thermohalobaculum sp.]|nr:TRAP transporter small permease subunit [Thermohalobaculum sp.]
AYVRWVDRVNRVIGRIVMWGIFAMMGILLWSSLSKTAPGMMPSLWTIEMAQFCMVGYYILGGAYSMQMRAHVRMDLVYGMWSGRTQASVDAVTILFLLVYLGFLLYGGISSTSYALEYGERSYSAWRPYMAPIKIVMVIGILMMLLQAVAQFFRDLAAARGVPLEETAPHGGFPG